MLKALVNTFVKCSNSLKSIEKMLERKLNTYKVIGIVIFSTTMTFMLFLLFIIALKEKYMG